MSRYDIKRKIVVFDNSSCNVQEYKDFLAESFRLLEGCVGYLPDSEDINSLELAHLIPVVPETALAIYLGINDAVCNKGLVTALLPQHGHNNVFVFDPEIYSGGDDVPGGTIDASQILPGFRPPNETWDDEWTYVMIKDPARTFESLWREKGYIDLVPAKFEDFTMMTDHNKSRLCAFVSPKAFEHPVNINRGYLKAARDRGLKMAGEFKIPDRIKDEFEGLEPVVLNKGEKLYVATTDFSPCAHGWTNIHPANEHLAVVNEISAVPLNLVIEKPEVNPKFTKYLVPAKGSADLTNDWFKRSELVMRKPLLEGLFQG